MKRLMIDMDDVITHNYTMDIINEFLGTDYKLEEQEDFYLQNLTKDRIDDYFELLMNTNLYGDCPLIEDCYEVMEKLNEKYELYIATAYLWNQTSDTTDSSANNLRNKYLYLKEKLPFIKPEQYIFIQNKNILNVDIKIDDKISNLKNCETKILFKNWHNKNTSNEELKEKNIIMVNNWKEIKDILL